MVAVLVDNRFAGSGQAGLVEAARLRRLPPRRLDASVYRRRRLMAVGVLLLAIAAVLVTVQSALAGTGGGPLTATGAAAGIAGPMAPAAAEVYVVRPGDTLWSIARTVQPHGDIRPLVDRLDARLGGATLYPGEPISLPRSPGGH